MTSGPDSEAEEKVAPVIAHVEPGEFIIYQEPSMLPEIEAWTAVGSSDEDSEDDGTPSTQRSSTESSVESTLTSDTDGCEQVGNMIGPEQLELAHGRSVGKHLEGDGAPSQGQQLGRVNELGFVSGTANGSIDLKEPSPDTQQVSKEVAKDRSESSGGNLEEQLEDTSP